MNKIISTMLFITLLFCFNTAVFAAELLDVKPIVSENSVTVEILADIPMTYTYYKIPGQARAVVDIAEADPEKVEPLIVVNKGAVSSISVDKADISGIIVSRIIFNLVSETDISVVASSDNKKLIVTFGSTGINKSEIKAEITVEPKESLKPVAELTPELKSTPSLQPEKIAIVAEAAKSTTDEASLGVCKEDDPLCLDEPTTKVVSKPVSAVALIPETIPVVVSTPKPAILPPTQPALEQHISKLKPVVPVSTSHSPLSIKEVKTGASYVDILTNQPITDYKTTRLSNPERLIIDIAAARINQKAKAFSINKFGISKTRIGIAPKNIRVVLDSNKASFPKHTITPLENGLRVNFK